MSTNDIKTDVNCSQRHQCQGFLGFHSLHGLLFLVQQLQENNLLFTTGRLLSRCNLLILFGISKLFVVFFRQKYNFILLLTTVNYKTILFLIKLSNFKCVQSIVCFQMFITFISWFWHRILISKNILRTSKSLLPGEGLNKNLFLLLRVVTGFTVIFFISIIVILLPVKPVFFGLVEFGLKVCAFYVVN